ncbi:MAG: hypothetical protein ABSG51_05525 [Terracidiphilus sp.]|jgi:hypothetical protein
MTYRFLLLFLTVSVLSVAGTVTRAQSAVLEPKTPIEWLQRANDQMSLRIPGAAPFHMKVTFHAFPGNELLRKKEQPQIIVGSGVYDEVWLAPHKWRREVTFTGYHAIEVESETGRKMQVSPEYEPSRVLMLLNALLKPIPRFIISEEFRSERGPGFKIEHLVIGNVSLVRLSKTTGMALINVNESYYFLPNGLLALENVSGLITSWGDDIIFAGKVVPRRISLKTGERELVSADVTIEGADPNVPLSLDLPVGLAEPGMTLRPIQDSNYKTPQLLSGPVPWGNNAYSDMSIWGVVDRTGHYREVELLLGVNANGDDYPMNEIRKLRWRPAEIDGSPCEVVAFLEHMSKPYSPLITSH